MRFDLDTLSAQLPKEERKKAKALNKTFFKEADHLDYSIRCKDLDEAQKALTMVKTTLDTALSSLV